MTARSTSNGEEYCTYHVHSLSIAFSELRHLTPAVTEEDKNESMVTIKMHVVPHFSARKFEVSCLSSKRESDVQPTLPFRVTVLSRLFTDAQEKNTERDKVLLPLSKI